MLANNVALSFVFGRTRTAFLRTDGKMEEDTKLEIILRHFDHLIHILGEDKVAIGSDFDGAKIPKKIKDVAGMNVLKEFLLTKGYNKNLIKKLFSENWLNFLYKYLRSLLDNFAVVQPDLIKETPFS